MRLAVVSDIHGNLVALEAVLADIGHRAADAIVNLGDCVTSPLWPRETFELLQTLSLPTVRGNHDRWMIESPPDGALSPSIRFTRESLSGAQRSVLAALPASHAVDEDILAVHGTPNSDSEYLLEDAVERRLALCTPGILAARLDGVRPGLVLCGHSHHQHMAAAGSHTVVNPGSVGCPRYADNEDRFANEAGTPHARYAVVTRTNGGWSVELIALEYQWRFVAQQAIANQRRDWAQGFLGA